MPFAPSMARRSRVARDSHHRRGERARIARVDVQRGVAGDFDERRRVRRDHRGAVRHRFRRRKSESFFEARHHQRDRVAVERGELVIADEAAHVDALASSKAVERRAGEDQRARPRTRANASISVSTFLCGLSLPT